ncbi:helix-turn-helix domain-containing protein [Mucilaginibacter sp. UC70_90]
MITDPVKSLKIGRNIARLRRLQGITQEELANRLKTSRQTVVKYEAMDDMDEQKLALIAGALGVTSEIIRGLNDDVLSNGVDIKFFDGSSLVNFNFNPVEKIVELYERMLQLEREKIDILKASLSKYEK